MLSLIAARCALEGTAFCGFSLRRRFDWGCAPARRASRCLIRRVALSLTFALLGCAHAPPPQPAPPSLASLTLSPASLGRSLSLSQLVTGEFNDRSVSLRFEVEVTPNRLKMVGLTHLGVPLFMLVQEGNDVHVENFVAEHFPFDPHHMLADLQLTYWPAHVLAPALQSLGLRLEQSDAGEYRRVLNAEGMPLVVIYYPPGSAADEEIVLTHYDFPYLLRVRTLDQEPRR